MANTTKLNPVDQLGSIRAQIAELRKQEKEIEDKLKKSGASTHEGTFFRATVSVYDRATVSWKDVAAKFNPSKQLITAHTSHAEVTKVAVVAKLTDKLAA